MDTNRIVRFSVAGWAFILSWPLEAWILGYGFEPQIRFLSSVQTAAAGTATFVVGLAAGPLFGFMLSSFTESFLVWKNGGTMFETPRGTDQARTFISALQQLLPAPEHQAILRSLGDRIERESNDEISGELSTELNNSTEPLFNLLFHSQAKETFIEYCTRRWTMFWMYVNTLLAVTLGGVFALITSGPFLTRDFGLLQIIIEVLLFSFMCVSYRHLGRLRRDIREIAWLWLYRESQSEQSGANAIMANK